MNSSLARRGLLKYFPTDIVNIILHYYNHYITKLLQGCRQLIWKNNMYRSVPNIKLHSITCKDHYNRFFCQCHVTNPSMGHDYCNYVPNTIKTYYNHFEAMRNTQNDAMLISYGMDPLGDEYFPPRKIIEYLSEEEESSSESSYDSYDSIESY